MDPSAKELKSYQETFNLELENILTWWQDHAVDEKGGGFCVLNARILWTFSAVAKMTGKTGYRDMALRAFEHKHGT